MSLSTGLAEILVNSDGSNRERLSLSLSSHYSGPVDVLSVPTIIAGAGIERQGSAQGRPGIYVLDWTIALKAREGFSTGANLSYQLTPPSFGTLFFLQLKTRAPPLRWP
jgi:hypothetical protein